MNGVCVFDFEFFVVLLGRQIHGFLIGWIVAVFNFRMIYTPDINFGAYYAAAFVKKACSPFFVFATVIAYCKVNVIEQIV
jgi:hypothetical protein